METSRNKNLVDKLKNYDYLAKDSDYISVTEWQNGEGYDIDVNGQQMFRLSQGELEAINYLVKTMEYKFSEMLDKDE